MNPKSNSGHWQNEANFWDNKYKSNQTGWDIGYISTPEIVSKWCFINFNIRTAF